MRAFDTDRMGAWQFSWIDHLNFVAAIGANAEAPFGARKSAEDKPRVDAGVARWRD